MHFRNFWKYVMQANKGTTFEVDEVLAVCCATFHKYYQRIIIFSCLAIVYPLGDRILQLFSTFFVFVFALDYEALARLYHLAHRIRFQSFNFCNEAGNLLDCVYKCIVECGMI